MNNFEKLKSMSVEELAKWLDKNGIIDNSPWMEHFNNKYCKNCESIMCKYHDSDYEFPAAFCEIHDTCRFFSDFNYVPGHEDIVKMWLEAEVRV
jgi:hypothetical protein